MRLKLPLCIASFVFVFFFIHICVVYMFYLNTHTHMCVFSLIVSIFKWAHLHVRSVRASSLQFAYARWNANCAYFIFYFSKKYAVLVYWIELRAHICSMRSYLKWKVHIIFRKWWNWVWFFFAMILSILD